MHRFATICLAAAAGLYLAFAWTIIVMAAEATTNDIPWASPAFKSIKRVSPIGAAQKSPDFLNNLDCTLLTYRQRSSTTMQSGCFTPTAFGFYDNSSSTIIFNGTDEGLSLKAYAPGQILVPWPKALNLVSLSNSSTGGTYLNLYKNPLTSLQNVYSFSGQIVGKQLTAPADVQLKDAAGNRLIINPQSLAFSDGGSWIVAETLNGAFVRVNLATLETRAFTQSFGAQGSPALLKSQVAISDNGRYVAIENTVAQSFKIYDLTTCTNNNTDWRLNGCKSYEYWQFMLQQIPQTSSVRQVRFVNEGLLSFEAVTPHTNTTGIYVMAPSDKITSLLNYIGLGDSYTSGEGAFNYRSGTDDKQNTCHLSIHSYPLLLTRDLYSAVGGNSVACSGARIRDIVAGNANYRGQNNKFTLQEFQTTQTQLFYSVLANYMPGYIAQEQFVKRYQPGVTTVSIGGNDIGFGDMLERCVMARLSRHLSDNVCYNTYEDRLEVIKLIDRTVPRWKTLYRQLQAAAPESRIYAIGYPDIVSDTGNCALNVHLNKSELAFSKELVRYLNGAIQQAASEVGVSYIDITEALAGHRLCETASHNVAVNGLTAGRDTGIFGIRIIGAESYHPNALGHQLIEQAILKQTDNFRMSIAPKATGNSAQVLLNVPKTNRQVNTVVPSKVTDAIVHRNVSETLYVDGAASGLSANASYIVKLDGSNGQTLFAATSDATGNLSGNIVLPVSVTTGLHTINVIGSGQADTVLDITQNIYVPGNDIDGDNDTIPDQADSCPYVKSAGIDEDKDGVDDACDSFIGLFTEPSGAQASSSPAVSSTGGGSHPSLEVAQPAALAPVTVTALPAANISAQQVNLQTTARVQNAAQSPQAPSGHPKRAKPENAIAGEPLIRISPNTRLMLLAWILLLLLLVRRRGRRLAAA